MAVVECCSLLAPVQLQLVLMVFFLPPTGAHTPLALEQLALCDGGLWWWYDSKLFCHNISWP